MKKPVEKKCRARRIAAIAAGGIVFILLSLSLAYAVMYHRGKAALLPGEISVSSPSEAGAQTEVGRVGGEAEEDAAVGERCCWVELREGVQAVDGRGGIRPPRARCVREPSIECGRGRANVKFRSLCFLSVPSSPPGDFVRGHHGPGGHQGENAALGGAALSHDAARVRRCAGR